MKSKNYLYVVSLVILTSGQLALAKDIDFKWSEIRLFISETSLASSPSDLNALTVADGVPELKKLTGFGLEATAELSSLLKVGTKFKGIFSGTNKEEGVTPSTAYLSVQQYSAGLTGRLAVANTPNVLFELFAELGLSNNTIEVRSTAGNATWTKDSHFYQRGGLAAGFGSKDFKFYAEGGYENFNLDGVSYEGTVGSTIKSIDLSGAYVGLGLIISGVPDWIKPKGISSN